jgi:hypothetical protein
MTTPEQIAAAIADYEYLVKSHREVAALWARGGDEGKSRGATQSAEKCEIVLAALRAMQSAGDGIPQRFMDQIDADRAAMAWIESRWPVDRIENHNHETSGRTISAWNNNNRLIAIAVVVRDEMNYSVLALLDLRKNQSQQDSQPQTNGE